nr:hypothetical protein GCM10020241_38830 [Streptoalloteichus tenebrarius]
MWRDAGGRVYRRGGRVTLLLRLATLAARLGLRAFAAVAFGKPFRDNALRLGIGVTFGVQQAVMTYRGRRLPASAVSSPSTSIGDQHGENVPQTHETPFETRPGHR